ncbi:GrpB family protein [Chamaesiphon sp. OTE_75_metabat_556]|uniref:GrpB family protein n=1 Tax=Chamaesiphon sp. OTE_75_metabat_556 TaxID=2964692 RepID=UPI00286B9615|nr:GrpB family protein [Chamaesiphon sp. OTE_75_metabat_556]
MTRKVEVVPHNRHWQSLFTDESQQLSIACGDNAIAIHHIGSTAIETIYAKPIIDILIEVKDLNKVDDRNMAIESLGYIAMGEFGIPCRRFFRKDDNSGIRTHHIHTFEVGLPQIARHLAFRDYLRSHPEAAQQYSQLKQKLAQQYPADIEGYMDGKAEFIKEIDNQASTL